MKFNSKDLTTWDWAGRTDASMPVSMTRGEVMDLYKEATRTGREEVLETLEEFIDKLHAE
jgi:hypothetical protein